MLTRGFALSCCFNIQYNNSQKHDGIDAIIMKGIIFVNLFFIYKVNNNNK